MPKFKMPKFTLSGAQQAKIWLASFLLLSLGPLLFFSSVAIRAIEADAKHVTSVTWSGTDRITPDATLADFYIDREHGKLAYRGKIDGDARRKLLALTPEGKASPKAIADFSDAIERLIYRNGAEPLGTTIHILLLGGLAGVLGVQLRSMTNFVGVACYTDKLDLKKWWPYYAVRPASGFLFGVVVVLVVQAGLLNVAKAGVETPWWAAIAFLAGFGEEEFTQRLRLITKTLFGEEKANKRGDGAVSSSGKGSDQ